jgi:hypothetical protein
MVEDCLSDCNFVSSSFKAEEHAEDYLRELEVLQKKVPELQDENEKLRAEGTHVSLLVTVHFFYWFAIVLD